ncbi:MAG: serine--tRNA ligase [Marinomonas sp.]
MHDIKSIRENPEAFDAGLARRGLEPQSAHLLELDAKRRAAATKLQEAQGRRNDASKAIGQAMGQGDKEKAEALKAEVAQIKADMPQWEEEDRILAAEVEEALAIIPNLPADDVPQGADEADNVEVAVWGEKPAFDFTPQEHADFAPALGMDFETGTKLSGARFTFLRGDMARLHRALGQFMLDQQTRKNGYTECAPPVLVNDDAMYGTDKLPKFAEDSFQTTEGRWLIPTAEVSLTASVMGDIVDDAKLPLRMTALTQCFRSEAGSAGKDTRGFIRQHQFEKCELVSVVRPEDSEAEHDRMTAAAEGILRALGLAYRKVLLCTGDMGFGARKTYDLEVWLPGQAAYREISSCSNTGDFQARRMKTRFKREGEKKTEFVHTLNGSGLAVGRTLVAVIENYQTEDGSVTVPEVLAPYMGGVTKLEPLS